MKERESNKSQSSLIKQIQLDKERVDSQREARLHIVVVKSLANRSG